MDDDTMAAGMGGGAVMRLETTDPEKHTLFWRRNGSDNRFDQLGAGRFRGAIAAEADQQLPAAPVDRDPFVGRRQHVGQLVAESSMADAKIVGKAE